MSNIDSMSLHENKQYGGATIFINTGNMSHSVDFNNYEDGNREYLELIKKMEES